MATRYTLCPWCGVKRMVYQVIDGVRYRTCFACFSTQRVRRTKSMKEVRR